MIGNFISFSDDTNPEEICPNSFCLCSPLHGLKETSETSENQPNSCAHVATPHLKKTAFTVVIFLQNVCPSCYYQSYSGSQCFRW